MKSALDQFRRCCDLTLGLTLLVILWGAFVRLSGSGDGCGASWPLCQGVLIPRSASSEMLVEFFHRLSSGLSFLFVLGVFLWSRRLFTRGAIERTFAASALGFMVTESLIGAALVLFEWVDQSAHPARVTVLAIHQVNTLLLLSSLLLTRLSVGKNSTLDWHSSHLPFLVGGYALLSLTAVFGVIAAVGSMLYPAETLLEGMQDDFSQNAPMLLRLRVFHPAIGIGTVVYFWWFLTVKLPQQKLGVEALLILFLMLQLVFGFITWLSNGSVLLKLVHLLLADCSVLALTALAHKVLTEGEHQAMLLRDPSREQNSAMTL